MERGLQVRRSPFLPECSHKTFSTLKKRLFLHVDNFSPGVFVWFFFFFFPLLASQSLCAKSRRGSCLGCRTARPWGGHLCNPSVVWAPWLGGHGWSNCWGGERQVLPCLHWITGKGLFLHKKLFHAVSLWCSVFTWTWWKTYTPSPPVFLTLYHHLSCCSRNYINSAESWACGEGKAGEDWLQKRWWRDELDKGMLWPALALLQ